MPLTNNSHPVMGLNISCWTYFCIVWEVGRPAFLVERLLTTPKSHISSCSWGVCDFAKKMFTYTVLLVIGNIDTNRSGQSRLWVMWRVWMNWEHLDGLCLVVWMWTITNTEVRDSGWEMAGWDQKIEGRVGGKRNERGESTTLHSPSRLFAL